jgi:hypothetical protein
MYDTNAVVGLELNAMETGVAGSTPVAPHRA